MSTLFAFAPPNLFKKSLIFWLFACLAFWGVGSLFSVLIDFNSWGTALFVGLLSGIIYGSLLWLTAFVGHYSFFIFVGPVVGGLIAYGGLMLPQGTWQSLKPAPEPIAEIITNLPFDVWGHLTFIRTKAGNIYTYDCQSSTGCDWQKVSELPSRQPVYSFPCGENAKPSSITPLPPGKVVQSYAFIICGADYGSEVHHILLEDGSLWYWERFDSTLVSLGFLLINIGAGFFTSIGAIAIAMALSLKPIWQWGKPKVKPRIKLTNP